MNILVVGGAGYLGGAVTDILLKTKHNIRVYDLLLYEDNYLKPIDFVYGDVRDKKTLSLQIKWADVVIWLAALVGDGACAINPTVSYEINEAAVKWLSQNYDRKIIFTSTCSVYGVHDQLLDENAPVNPLSVYASTKLDAEKHLLKAQALIFRLGTLFGISDSFSRIRMDLVVNRFTAKAHMYNRIKVFGGNQSRPIFHVRDAAKTICENINSKHSGIFNLHYKNINILELAQQIKKHFSRLVIEKAPLEFDDPRNYQVTSDKAKKLLQFKTKLTIDDGIKEIKKLLQEKRIKDINSPRFTNQQYLSIVLKNL